MLANVDYFVTLPNGETAILEIKTTNYNAKDNWWIDGEETIPVNYQAQGRHYMAVMNLNHVFYCCLYGNSEDDVIIRHIERDAAYEAVSYTHLDVYKRQGLRTMANTTKKGKASRRLDKNRLTLRKGETQRKDGTYEMCIRDRHMVADNRQDYDVVLAAHGPMDGGGVSQFHMFHFFHAVFDNAGF